MRHGNVGRVMACLAALLMTCGVLFAQDVPWATKRAESKRPRTYPASKWIIAEEVARQDADSKLAERIYGIALNADTDVLDLALADRTIQTRLRADLRGMKTTARKYYQDGRIEIARKVTLREVVEIIERTYKEVRKRNRLISMEELEDIRRESRDTDIVVVGRGAVKRSDGMKKIRAMRAAEVDCYARIAARVFGKRINRDTTVGEFVLEHDLIRAKVRLAIMYGVKFTKYEFVDDSAEATGELTMREVVEVIERTYRRHERKGRVTIEEIEDLKRETRDTTFRETGRGIMGGATTAAAGDEEFEEIKTIFERPISRGILVQ